jgi:hypothetical protein
MNGTVDSQQRIAAVNSTKTPPGRETKVSDYGRHACSGRRQAENACRSRSSNASGHSVVDGNPTARQRHRLISTRTRRDHRHIVCTVLINVSGKLDSHDPERFPQRLAVVSHVHRRTSFHRQSTHGNDRRRTKESRAEHNGRRTTSHGGARARNRCLAGNRRNPSSLRSSLPTSVRALSIVGHRRWLRVGLYGTLLAFCR